jgi:outer membrane immunogenic protein
MFKKVLAASALFFASLQASAQEMPMPSAPADDMVIRAGIDDTEAPRGVSPDRWLGAYAGLTGGYSHIWDSFEANANGKLIGGFAGYNIRVAGRFAAGLEAEYANFKRPFDDGSGVEATESFTAKIRGGYAHDRFFAYGMIGAQHATSKAVLATPVGPLSLELADTTYVLGAGVDVAVTDRLSVGAEYSRAFYHSYDYPKFPLPVDVRTQQFKARVAYKIN